MKNFISKLTNNMPLLGSILFLMLSQWMAAQTGDAALKTFLNDPELKSASISIQVKNLATGNSVLAHDANKTLITASTMKAMTTSTALEILGPDHVFHTKICYTGKLVDGILQGDLIIRGEGDPTLGGDYFKEHHGNFYENWLAELKLLGIQKIDGDIIGDGSYFSGPSLPGSTAVGDIGNYYGAGAHALSIYDNSYVLHFSSQNKDHGSTQVVSTVPEVPYLTITNKVEASKVNKDRAYIFGVPNDPYQTVFGSIPMGKTDFEIKGSIPQPERLVAVEFRNLLLANGIEVSGESYSSDQQWTNTFESMETKLIIDHESPTLDKIVKRTNYKSLNSYANILLFHIAKSRGSSTSFAAGVEALKYYWSKKGVDVNQWFQEDGSGLSRANALSADHMVSVLLNVSDVNREILKQGLKPLNKDQAILSKSGYMNRVRSYTGYLKASSGKEFAFSVIANNYDCSAGEMRKKIEKFMRT